MLYYAGNTALILACRGGMHECVAALLEARADANQRGQGGKTPLISAAEFGYTRAIPLLLQASSLRPHTLLAEGLIH
jgi:ankyrin repeat protein